LQAWLEAVWERFATLENAESALRNIRALAEQMHNQTKFPEHLHFPFMNADPSVPGDSSTN
jgi:hypothetical protein